MPLKKMNAVSACLFALWLPSVCSQALAVEQDPTMLGPVTSKDTLWQLAKTARGDAPYTMYQTIVALRLKNPAAFIGENVHHVQLGAVLQLPTAAEIAAIDANAAELKVEADAGYWQQWVSSGKREKPQASPWSGTMLADTVSAQQPVVAAMNSSEVNTPAAANGVPNDALNSALNSSLTSSALPPTSNSSEQSATLASERAHVPAPSSTQTTNAEETLPTTEPITIDSDTTLSGETRLFPSKAEQGQSQLSASVSVLQEWHWQSEDEKSSWSLSPYVRVDAQDPKRNLLDVRQASWLQVGDGWELKAGIDQIFWGVTESQHLVDVINQTDLADRPDGEAKLGQPMVQLSLLGEWGNLQTLVLPWFRERTFAGPDGRLRLPYPVNRQQALYESDAEQQHVDWAVRYAKQLDQVDLALSYFKGTSRDPLWVMSPAQNELLPYYQQMQQWGLEGQWIVDSWIWKLEAMRRQTKQDRYSAYTTGFEYSSIGVLESPVDVGWIVEYQYDSRGMQALTPAQRDLFFGARIAFNDEAGSELLFGLGQDLQNGSTRIGKLEASSRYNNSVRLRLDAWLFQTDDIAEPIWWFRHDDYVQLGLDYYF